MELANARVRTLQGFLRRRDTSLRELRGGFFDSILRLQMGEGVSETHEGVCMASLLLLSQVLRNLIKDFE